MLDSKILDDVSARVAAGIRRKPGPRRGKPEGDAERRLGEARSGDARGIRYPGPRVAAHARNARSAEVASSRSLEARAGKPR